MDTKTAIIAMSQSEKVKSGLIWMAQSVEIFSGCLPGQQPGAEKIIGGVTEMIAAETMFARKITGDDTWIEVEKSIDLAMVMIRSGVVPEATYHFSRALSQVTGIGQRAMIDLKKAGLL